MESVTTFEDPGYAYEHTLDLIRRTPDLAALWVAGGGIEGVMQAIADAGAAERLVTIGRDLTVDTRAGLIDGTIRLVLSHPIRAMAAAAVGSMVAATSEGGASGSSRCCCRLSCGRRRMCKATLSGSGSV